MNEEVENVVDQDKYQVLKTADMAKNLGIAESTVRKYAQSMEKAGYQFMRDETGSRVYRNEDEKSLYNLIQLRKRAGVSLEMASDIIATRQEENVSATQGVQSLSEKGFSISRTRYEKRFKEELREIVVNENIELKKEIEDLKREVAETNKLLRAMAEEKNQSEGKEEKKISGWRKFFS